MSVSLVSESASFEKYAHIDMRRVVSVILGGGQGKRLFPLTMTRCKPAISFGGRYRLIDVPISNSINSGCRKIFVLTQFLSSSLHHHITTSYRFDGFSSGFIELIAAEQKPTNHEWFQGTADAVRQSMEYFLETPCDYFLILSGDQLYHLNFRKMIHFAKKQDADLLIASIPTTRVEARRMGIMHLASNGKIEAFYEKPQDDSLLDSLKQNLGEGREDKEYIASMGIYIFKRDALLKILEEDKREDFGKHLIPSMIQKGNTYAYIHDGYWEDIGTIRAFYEANIALTEPLPLFNCYDENHPIFSSRLFLPGAKFQGAKITSSIICDGSIIDEADIESSIVGNRAKVGAGSRISHSYITGNDFYEPPTNTPLLPRELKIGKRCVIEGAIVDKNVCIEDDVVLVNQNHYENYDGEHLFVRDGVIVVPRGARIPSGTRF